MTAIEQINSIKQRADRIEDYQNIRSPNLRRNLYAKLCGWKWLLKSIKSDCNLQEAVRLLEQLKQIKLQLNTLWYRVAEQGELATKLLCELDNVLSEGDQTIRELRKAQVCRIQQLIDDNDALKTVCDDLKRRGEDWLAPFVEQMEATVANAMDVDSTENRGEPAEPEAEIPPNTEEEEMEIADERMETEEQEPEAQETRCIDPQQLPIWEPLFQFQEEQNGLHLRVDLRGVEDEHVTVNYDDSGLLQVSGYKLPSDQDIQLRVFEGIVNYGRFNIEKRLPTRSLCLDEASMKRGCNGILDICIPYRRYRRRQSRHNPWLESSQRFGIPVGWY